MDEVSLPNPTYDVDVEQGAPDDTQSDGSGGDDLIQARDVLAKTNKLLTLAHMAGIILFCIWTGALCGLPAGGVATSRTPRRWVVRHTHTQLATARGTPGDAPGGAMTVHIIL